MERKRKPLRAWKTIDGGERVRRTKDGKEGWRLVGPAGPDGSTPVEETFYGSEAAATRRLEEMHGRARSAPVALAPRHRSIPIGVAAQEFIMNCRWRIPPNPESGYEGVKNADSTVVKWINMLNLYLVPGLGPHRKLQTVTTQLLIEVITACTLQDSDPPAPVAPGTMATIAAAAKKFFGWCVQTGRMTNNPAADLPATWTRDQAKRSMFKPRVSDVERLACALDRVWPLPRWARDLYGPNGEGRGDLLRLLEYTGLRWEEFTALSVNNIFKRDRVMWIADVATESSGRRDYRPDDGKTRAARRPVIILPEAIPVIERLDAIRRRGQELEPERLARRERREENKRVGEPRPRSRNRPDEDLWKLLVCGERGGFISYSHWNKKLAEAKELLRVELLTEQGSLTPQDQAMLELTAHLCRHVNASILKAAGMPWDFVAGQLGHSNGRVAQEIYVHPIEVDIVAQAQRISDFRAGLTELERAHAAASFDARIAMRAAGQEDAGSDTWGLAVA